MRIEWEMATRVQREAGERSQHPAPELITEWGDAAGHVLIPTAVLKLSEQAREAGWEVRVRYARGTLAKTLVHSLAVSFADHPLGVGSAVAVYAKAVNGAGAWSWRSVWLWGPQLKHFGAAGVTELREWLLAGGQVEPRWYAEVRTAVAARQEAAKVRAACMRGAHPGDAVVRIWMADWCTSCRNACPAVG